MKTVPLTQGYKTQIDDEDYEMVCQFFWQVKKQGRTAYAIASVSGKTVYLHRLILNLEDGDVCVDHIDGNGLNNTKANLRTCTHSQNCRNRRKKKTSASRFKGVTKYGETRWRARVGTGGGAASGSTHLGYFPTEEAAARAYNEAAILRFGEFARLNQI